jgi:hypothetical protein
MTDKEPFFGVCDVCHEKKWIPYVDAPDPFMEEVYPEDLVDSMYKNWCEDCYRESCMDI